MSVEQQGNMEAKGPYGACPIRSIVTRQEDTQAFFDDRHLPYIQGAYRIPEEDSAYARQMRDTLWEDPRALEAYAQSILNEAYELNDLIRRGHYDTLTGLPKGEVWLEHAREAVRQCEESGGEDWLAVLVIDLSGFKRVNDTAGHKAGDDLLEKMGEGLRKHTRPEDVAASLGRMGGDEFAVLLRFGEAQIQEKMDREVRTARAAKRIASLLDAMFAESLNVMRAKDERLKSLTVTAVTGYATWSPGMTAEQLLMAADDAMNEAKGQRREAELQALSPEQRAAYKLIRLLARNAGLGIDERMIRF